MALPELPADSELTLETPRLELEPITLAHADELCELLRDPELHRFTPTEPPTLEQQRAQCTRWSTRRSPDGTELWLNWAARHSSTHAIVGYIQVGIRDDLATLAYLIARRVQRDGLAAEAVRRVITFVHERLHVSSFEARIDTRNHASIALVQRLGFEQVDLIRNAAVIKGVPSDEYVFVRRAAPSI